MFDGTQNPLNIATSQHACTVLLLTECGQQEVRHLLATFWIVFWDSLQVLNAIGSYVHRCDSFAACNNLFSRGLHEVRFGYFLLWVLSLIESIPPHSLLPSLSLTSRFDIQPDFFQLLYLRSNLLYQTNTEYFSTV